MTKTEKFRKLLDERGVKWWEGWNKDITVFDGANSVRYQADCTLGELFVRSILTITPEQAVAATVGAQEVYLLMGTDTYDGREYVLGVFSTEEEAEAAISDNGYGYGLHNVQRWEVDA